MTPKFRAAAKQLREDEDIIIRKADKSSVYVILDRKDYNDKLDTILSDESKFKRITKDPTSEVKKEANRLITAANAENGGMHFKKISNDLATCTVEASTMDWEPAVLISAFRSFRVCH